MLDPSYGHLSSGILVAKVVDHRLPNVLVACPCTHPDLRLLRIELDQFWRRSGRLINLFQEFGDHEVSVIQQPRPLLFAVRVHPLNRLGLGRLRLGTDRCLNQMTRPGVGGKEGVTAIEVKKLAVGPDRSKQRVDGFGQPQRSAGLECQRRNRDREQMANEQQAQSQPPAICQLGMRLLSHHSDKQEGIEGTLLRPAVSTLTTAAAMYRDNRCRDGRGSERC